MSGQPKTLDDAMEIIRALRDNVQQLQDEIFELESEIGALELELETFDQRPELDTVAWRLSRGERDEALYELEQYLRAEHML